MKVDGRCWFLKIIPFRSLVYVQNSQSYHLKTCGVFYHNLNVWNKSM